MRHRFLVLVVAVVFVVVAPGRALAHDLKATVKLLPDAVVVEASFDDDAPAEDAVIVIVDGAGAEVARGKTDERGVCRLPMLGPGEYVAIVESIGHRDEVKFEVAGSSGMLEFSRWRLDKRLGLAIGVGALLALSAAFWWVRLRKPTAGITAGPTGGPAGDSAP
jgi:hypothetical protein